MRIAVSDCEHVEDAELAEFDVEKWQKEKVEERRMKIIKTNGTILSISLAVMLLIMMVVCLIIASIFVSPLCLDDGSSKWLSLQHFLFCKYLYSQNYSIYFTIFKTHALAKLICFSSR